MSNSNIHSRKTFACCNPTVVVTKPSLLEFVVRSKPHHSSPTRPDDFIKNNHNSIYKKTTAKVLEDASFMVDLLLRIQCLAQVVLTNLFARCVMTRYSRLRIE